jgi:hypothetical protein
VQHALRAFTPRDQAAVKSAAETFRSNPGVDVEKAITELKVGEALVSLLLPDGSPAPVERVLIKAPASRVGPLADAERQLLVATDAVGAKYDAAVDRASAEEILAAKTREAAAATADAKARTDNERVAAREAREQAQLAKEQARLTAIARRDEDRLRREREREDARRAREAARPSTFDKALQSATRSAASSIGRQLGNQLLRGLLGGLFRGR